MGFERQNFHLACTCSGGVHAETFRVSTISAKGMLVNLHVRKAIMKQHKGGARRPQAFIWCLWIILVVAFPFTPPASGISLLPPEPAKPTFQDPSFLQGRLSLKKGDLPLAEQQFNQSLQEQPNNPWALIGLADVAVQRGTLTDAEPYLQRAVTVAPTNAQVHQTWGRYLLFQKKYRQAESALQHALQLDPNNVPAYIDLGDVYLSGFENPEKAINNYKQALRLDTVNAGAYYALGSAFAKLGKFPQAEAYFLESSRLSPTLALPFQALGELQASQKEFQKAKQNLSKAIELDPTNYDAHLTLGDIHFSLNQDSQAIAAYQTSVNVNPDLAVGYLKLGRIYEKIGEKGKAKQAYLRTIQADPTEPIAYNNLAWMAAEENTNLDEALMWGEKAVSLTPDSPQFHDTLGWVYRARGEPAKAETALQKSSKLDPEKAEVWFHLGIVLQEQGKDLNAKQAFQKAFDLGQDFPTKEQIETRLRALKKN